MPDTDPKILLSELSEAVHPQLSAMKDELERSIAIVSEAGASLVRSFQGLEAQARAQEALLHDVFSAMGSEGSDGGLQAFVHHTSDVLSELTQLLGRLSEDGGDSLGRLEGLEGHFDEISRTLVRIEDIAVDTRLLSVNARIQAAQAGDSGSGFGVVASAVGDLARYSRDLGDQIADQVDETRQALSGVSEVMHHLVDRSRKVSHDGDSRVGTLLDEFDLLNRRMLQGLDRLSVLTREARDHASLAIRSLQFDDVVGQLLRGVRGRLDHLEATLEAALRIAEDPDAETNLGPSTGSPRSAVSQDSLAPGDVELF